MRYSNTILFQISILLLLIVMPFAPLYAQKFCVGKLCYSRLGGDSVEVDGCAPNKLFTRLIVPSQVSYNDSVFRIVSLHRYCFDEQKCLRMVQLPEGVSEIPDCAFLDCKALRKVILPSTIQTIGFEAFCDCKNLSSITLPEGIVVIGTEAFNDCKSLKSITIPASTQRVEDNVFSGCSSLVDAYLLGEKTSFGTNVFTGCTKLCTPLYTPNVFVYLPNDYCRPFTIPDGIRTIAGGAFNGCNSLPYVYIPNSVDSIGAIAFGCCFGLDSITLPLQLKSIGDGAFRTCVNLRHVTIPSEVSYIGRDAFENCLSLKTIVCQPVYPPHLSDHQRIAPCGELIKVVIFLPESAIRLYRETEGWKCFLDYRPIKNTIP